MKDLIIKALREHVVEIGTDKNVSVVYESSFDDVADAIVKALSSDVMPDNLSDSMKLFKFLLDLKAKKNTGPQFKPGGWVNDGRKVNHESEEEFNRRMFRVAQLYNECKLNTEGVKVTDPTPPSDPADDESLPKP